MANEEELNLANQGAPAADIPDLKKREKERKKAGAAWGGGKPGGGSFSGASGGAGGAVARAAASAASASGGVAAAGTGGWFSSMLAGLSGWLSSTLARLTATILGKMILAAGIALVLAGAGVVGYGLLYGENAAGVGGSDGGQGGALTIAVRPK